MVSLPEFSEMKQSIPVINHSSNALPVYATPGAAGLDLMASVPEPVCIEPGERKLIGTGLHIALPEGFEAQIRPRSGLALKHGITVLNSPGTVDSDYRGEIKVLLINHSNETFQIENGDRIAQMVVHRHEYVQLVPADQLPETQRGEGGYGHTGIKSNNNT